MKKIIYSIICLSLLACSTGGEKGSNSESTETGMEHSTDHTSDEDTATEEAGLSDQEFEKFREVQDEMVGQLVDAYLKIKDALVATNGAEAKDAATSMNQNLKDVEGEALTMIREDIEHIAETESVEHQREHFNTLSEHMYALVKANQTSGTTLYRQYCPMAFKNTGAFWLSSSEEIRNPYFGDKMLKCGRVQETIQ